MIRVILTFSATVEMTQNVKKISDSFLSSATRVVEDLSREMDDAERFGRLLDALLVLIPCDAVAILRLEGRILVPLSSKGFCLDMLGRRFSLDAHPRLETMVHSDGPVHFASDSVLPDPYDGLVDGEHDQWDVHDCLGCAIRVRGRVWGVLTLDSLDPHRFSGRTLSQLRDFVSLAAAVVVVAERIDRLHEKLARLPASVHPSRELIGVSAAHVALRQEIETVADSDLTVLVTGPTGVGKELVAEALHRESARKSRPLVRVNCAALTVTLVESELFGHVRGAFSGAVDARRGAFEMADQATLFLDEIGELPLAVQAKLLRVLQDGHLQRVGSDREHHVDVRVIAATNRDLAYEVSQGRFRADLYHRLSVYPLHVPALVARPEDILPLAGYFLEQSRGRLGVRGLRLSARATDALTAYEWPGNGRELEHVLSRAALRAARQQRGGEGIVTIDVDVLDIHAAEMHVPDAHRASLQATMPSQGTVSLYGRAVDETDTSRALSEATDAFRRAYIAAALERHQGVWVLAAKDLGVDPANLHRLAKRLGLKMAS